MAACTGMRRGELLGLSWDDVDLARRTIRVAWSLTVLHGKIERGPTKTARPRTLTFDKRVFAALASQHRQQQRWQNAHGAQWHNAWNLVFTTDDGHPLLPNSVTRTFKREVERAGLSHATVHTLRHLHATLLLQAGVPVKVVSERLGHATARRTLDTYTTSCPPWTPPPSSRSRRSCDEPATPRAEGLPCRGRGVARRRPAGRDAATPTAPPPTRSAGAMRCCRPDRAGHRASCDRAAGPAALRQDVGAASTRPRPHRGVHGRDRPVRRADPRRHRAAAGRGHAGGGSPRSATGPTSCRSPPGSTSAASARSCSCPHANALKLSAGGADHARRRLLADGKLRTDGDGNVVVTDPLVADWLRQTLPL